MNCRLVKIQYILSYYRSWCVVWTQNINYYSDQPLHYETYHHHDHKLGTLGIWGADFTGESCGALIQYTIVQCEMLHMDSVKRHYGNISRNIVDSFSNANTRGPRTEITQRTLRLHPHRSQGGGAGGGGIQHSKSQELRKQENVLEFLSVEVVPH